MSVLGWIFTLGVFLFVVNATYPTAGLGGSVLAGGFLALIYVARVASHTRPSAPPQPTTLDAYGRAVLGNLVDEFARIPGSGEFMPHRDLVQRGRAPSDREQVGLIKLAALMQRCHENPIGDKDYAAMSANSEAMDSTFKLIYGHDPSYDEHWAFTNMIGTSYPADEERANRFNAEAARRASEALQSYAKDGTQKVKICGSSDQCPACAAVDGRVFALAAVPPVPVPGCSHKVCRCRYRPVV